LINIKNFDVDILFVEQLATSGWLLDNGYWRLYVRVTHLFLLILSHSPLTDNSSPNRSTMFIRQLTDCEFVI
jgi:hypothetical protein